MKRILHDCYLYRRYEGKSYRILLPPPLPSFRVQETHPFSNIGVDFAGPKFVKLASRAQV